MKLQSSLFLIILCICISIQANGQVPGYLGKRLSLEYGFEFGIPFKGVTQNNKGYGNVLTADSQVSENKSFGINYNHNARISYVVSRTKSYGIQVSQYYTGVVTRMETPSKISEFGIDTHRNLHRLNVKTIGVVRTSFLRNRGALAPLGEYYTLGLDRMWVTGEIIDRTVFVNNSATPSEIYRPVSLDQTFNLYAFSIGAGTNRILYDRFIFKIGVVIRVPIVLQNTGSFFRQEYFADERFSTDPHQVIFEMDTYRRLVGHNFMKLELGFGILL